MMLPNRIRAPLTADEELAEQHGGQLNFLREIAQETGNRSLLGITRAIQAEKRQQARETLRRATGTR